jgi:hypothetical protein
MKNKLTVLAAAVPLLAMAFAGPIAANAQTMASSTMVIFGLVLKVQT